jgi:ribosomal protein L11 methylase PrmA
MKVRDSGMPDEEAQWNQFFDPGKILQQMELTAEVNDVADLGCGFGTFSLPASQIITGKIHAFDIDEN